MMAVLGPVFGVLGAGSGAGVLALARAGDTRARLNAANERRELE